MKNTFRNISLFLMAIIVLFLSIGMSISRMKCADNGQLYFGTDVPSCSMDKEVVCQAKQEKVSCCSIEVEKQCCPETMDKSCASETENIQFDFETTISVNNFDYFLSKTSFFYISTFNHFLINERRTNYLSGIPPPKISKPILSQIQTLLL